MTSQNQLGTQHHCSNKIVVNLIFCDIFDTAIFEGSMARRPDEEEESGWETAAKIAVGVTAAAVGIGAIIGAMSRVTTETQHQPHSSYTVHEPSSDEEEHPWAYAGRAVPGWSLTRQEPRALAGQAAITCNSHYQGSESAIILSRPKISNINTLLDKIYIHHIHLKKEEFEEHYRVFQDMFRRLNEAMKDVDPYYRRYSSMKEFAGSHYDGLRIIKPDEIDVDIVIRLPANMCMDVGLEPRAPGYVQLRMGTQFQKLPYREDFHINMTAHKWMDERHYLLRSRFLYWFRGVVDRALNCFPKNNYGQHYSRIGDMVHTISTSGGGPAVTLIIENETGFKLNVDLVPAIRFPEERWPICRGYREIPPNCKREYFLVVPKENKALVDKRDQDRAWRLALHFQERELMNDTNHLRQTIRFIKKLRDSQKMPQISSYFIKTLFYHEVMRLPDALFWNKSCTKLLILMVRKLEEALRCGEIPYFWNKDLNLLWDVNRSTLTGYANKLREFARSLEASEFSQVARYLLTREEYETFQHRL